MTLISVEHLTHTYTGRLLFDDASFYLNDNEKTGIVGINGTGKSTLLKIIAGIEEPDHGTVTTSQNLRTGYLPQTPLFDEGLCVLDAALLHKIYQIFQAGSKKGLPLCAPFLHLPMSWYLMSRLTTLTTQWQNGLKNIL